MFWDQRDLASYFFIKDCKSMNFGFPTSHFPHGVDSDGSNMEMYADIWMV